MTELSPAAQAVKRDIAQIMQGLSKYCRVSISATDALPITLEAADASLEAGINALCAAALRAAVATGGLKTPGGGVILDGNFLLAIAAELEGHG